MEWTEERRREMVLTLSQLLLAAHQSHNGLPDRILTFQRLEVLVFLQTQSDEFLEANRVQILKAITS